MQIITNSISLDALKQMAAQLFGDMVKGVVDVDRELIAIDAELHADLEALLLADGSKQESVWGINVYPDLSGDDFVEFDSMINVRPLHNNRSRGVEDENMRRRIMEIVRKRVQR